LSKKRELLLRTPTPELFQGEEVSYLDQIFDGLLLLFRLEIDDFQIFSANGLYPDGGMDEEFAEFQTFCKKLGPDKLGFAEVSLLNQRKTIFLLGGKIEF
jgi:hypothetical protein